MIEVIVDTIGIFGMLFGTLILVAGSTDMNKPAHCVLAAVFGAIIIANGALLVAFNGGHLP